MSGPKVRAMRRSTMGHEMAHVVGEHRFGTSLVNERGWRRRRRKSAFDPGWFVDRWGSLGLWMARV